MDAGRRAADAARAQADALDLRAVILVEGASDHAAVDAAARRIGRDLLAERVAIVPMEGFSGIGRFLDRYGPAGRDVSVAGLCDANEARYFRRALERAGFGAELTEAAMAALGFFVCHDDLEDELIRALGAVAVEDVLADQGELVSFRRFQRQPAQRERTVEAQLHRFIGTRSGRKLRLARVIVDALDPAAIPPPLRGVLGA